MMNTTCHREALIYPLMNTLVFKDQHCNIPVMNAVVSTGKNYILPVNTMRSTDAHYDIH